MFHTQYSEKSPLRILDSASAEGAASAGSSAGRSGGLGKGKLGVVAARAGVGKTAFLVHIALDSLLRERKVMHVSLDSSVDHVKSWYDAVFQDLVRATGLEDVSATLDIINRNRIIQAFSLHGGQSSFGAGRLRSALDLLAEHASFRPDVVLIDAYDWTRTNEQELEALLALAKEGNFELWTTAVTHRHQIGSAAPDRVPPPCDRFDRHLDLVLFLQPTDGHLSVRLLKHHERAVSSDTALILHTDTMRLVDGRAPSMPIEDLPPSAYTMLSGGAVGAEQEFGALAERYGLREENFSFEGHKVARTRGLRLLSDEELRDGDVSLAYVSATMHRPYHQNALLRKVLQSIWHQVNSSQSVFIIGVIQPDDTVKGGTGWAAELARHQGKPLHVYDQERRRWFTWDHTARSWQPSQPVIKHTRFTGTGTRSLTEDGRAAIEELFRTSFRGARPGRSGSTPAT